MKKKVGEFITTDNGNSLVIAHIDKKRNIVYAKNPFSDSQILYIACNDKIMNGKYKGQYIHPFVENNIEGPDPDQFLANDFLLDKEAFI